MVRPLILIAFTGWPLNDGDRIVGLDKKGRLEKEKQRPITSPTFMSFGGNNYQTLFVSSEQAFPSPKQLAQLPQPGSIFAIHNLGICACPKRFSATERRIHPLQSGALPRGETLLLSSEGSAQQHQSAQSPQQNPFTTIKIF